jgi:hypothetical protein
VAPGIVGGRVWLCILLDGGSGNNDETAYSQARYLRFSANFRPALTLNLIEGFETTSRPYSEG